MKLVIQRVSEAGVTVDGELVSSIGKGYLVFFGAGEGDVKEDAERLANKMINLRIFSDENDKINLSLENVGGELLIVSQFTLYADCKKGHRPGFTDACEPKRAEELYGYIVKKCTELVGEVGTGEFGADMKVSLTNDGPFTIILDSERL